MKNFLGIIFIIGIVVFVGVSLSYKGNQNISSKTANTNSPPKITDIVSEKDVPQVTIIAENLEVPWGISFLPDEQILVTERTGKIRLIDQDYNLLPEPVLTLDVVQRIQGEGGLHGIILHPDFDENKFVYIYYTYESTNGQTLNRVDRYILENNKLIQNKVIIDRIPGSLFHDGGRIKFGPDDNLYITTGDAQNPELAQDTGSLAGKILRVTDEGGIPSGNPFGNAVYSYGHRNPQGIAWDDDNNLWSTEHGRSGALSGLDEVNFIEIGKNYGWPEIQGDEERNGMEKPIRHSGAGETWAPACAVILENRLFFSGLRGEALYETVIESNQTSGLKEHFKNEYGRIRECVLGPDDMLYITTSNRDGRGNVRDGDDKILRINPNKLQ